jgi:hypothetical protein
MLEVKRCKAKDLEQTHGYILKMFKLYFINIIKSVQFVLETH